jgi:hypothetical protein
LVEGICRELQILPPGTALEIPLSDVDGVGMAKLRSAIHRAAASKQLAIETLADKGNLYVWGRKKTQWANPCLVRLAYPLSGRRFFLISIKSSAVLETEQCLSYFPAFFNRVRTILL